MSFTHRKPFRLNSTTNSVFFFFKAVQMDYPFLRAFELLPLKTLRKLRGSLLLQSFHFLLFSAFEGTKLVFGASSHRGLGLHTSSFVSSFIKRCWRRLTFLFSCFDICCII